MGSRLLQLASNPSAGKSGVGGERVVLACLRSTTVHHSPALANLHRAEGAQGSRGDVVGVCVRIVVGCRRRPTVGLDTHLALAAFDHVLMITELAVNLECRPTHTTSTSFVVILVYACVHLARCRRTPYPVPCLLLPCPSAIPVTVPLPTCITPVSTTINTT